MSSASASASSSLQCLALQCPSKLVSKVMSILKPTSSSSSSHTSSPSLSSPPLPPFSSSSSPYLFQLPHLKSVQTVPEDNHQKIILLNPMELSQFPPSFIDFMKSNQLQTVKYNIPEATLTSAFSSPSSTSNSPSSFSLSSSSPLADLLKAHIPSSLHSLLPSGMESVGHIAHIKLPTVPLSSPLFPSTSLALSSPHSFFSPLDPYKYLIGNIILQRFHPRITLVVVKVGIISNEFRVLPMEIIGCRHRDFIRWRRGVIGNIKEEIKEKDKEHNGDSDDNNADDTPFVSDESLHLPTDFSSLSSLYSSLSTSLLSSLFLCDHREHSIRYHFNFQTVYWNSKLSTEHQRLIHYIQYYETNFNNNKKNRAMIASKDSTDPQSLIVDLFCGIGPFLLPSILHHQFPIIGNDLNPHSARYCKENLILNCYPHTINGKYNHSKQKQKESQFLHKSIGLFNDDARKIIKYLSYKTLTGHIHPPSHFIMNLPAMAIEFLNEFVGIYNEQNYDEKDDEEQKDMMSAFKKGEINDMLEDLRPSPFSSKSTPSSPPSTPSPSSLQDHLPLIHVYCFSSSPTPVLDIVKRIESQLDYSMGDKWQFSNERKFKSDKMVKGEKGREKENQNDNEKEKEKERKENSSSPSSSPSPVHSSNLNPYSSSSFSIPFDYSHDNGIIYLVRNVSPNKNQYCASFRLPKEVAFRRVKKGEGGRRKEENGNVAMEIEDEEGTVSVGGERKRKEMEDSRTKIDGNDESQSQETEKNGRRKIHQEEEDD